MGKLRSSLKRRLSIVGMLFKFLKEQRLWWMIPLISVLLFLGGLIIVAQQTALGPFIYTLF